MVILIDQIFLLVNLRQKENLTVAFRNVKTKKRRLLRFSIQRTEINWPGCDSVYPASFIFLFCLPPLLSRPSPHTSFTVFLLKGLRKELESCQDGLTEAAAVSARAMNQEVSCTVQNIY